MKLGFQPVNISVQAYGNAVHAPGASPWTVRAAVCITVSQVNQGAGEDDNGAKAETTGWGHYGASLKGCPSTTKVNQP